MLVPLLVQDFLKAIDQVLLKVLDWHKVITFVQVHQTEPPLKGVAVDFEFNRVVLSCAGVLVPFEEFYPLFLKEFPHTSEEEKCAKNRNATNNC